MGLSWTLAIAIALVVSGQITLALKIAVFALVLLYLIHSVALLALPRLNPDLFRSVTVRVPLNVQRLAAWFSILGMSVLVLVQVFEDLATLRALSFAERVAGQRLTTLELSLMWAALGALLYVIEGRRAQPVSQRTAGLPAG